MKFSTFVLLMMAITMGTPAFLRPAESSPLDTLLAACPTQDEVNEIISTFHIHIPDKYTYHCAADAGADESAVVLSIVNSFRVMKMLTFFKPLPLIDTPTLYDWFASLDLTLNIVTDQEQTHAHGHTIYLNARYLAHPDNRRFFSFHRNEAGTAFVIGLLLHEARHTIPGGEKRHNCGWQGLGDSTVAYGGAWALQFYYYYWLAHHTSQLTTVEKERANELAVDIVLEHICRLD